MRKELVFLAIILSMIALYRHSSKKLPVGTVAVDNVYLGMTQTDLTEFVGFELPDEEFQFCALCGREAPCQQHPGTYPTFVILRRGRVKYVNGSSLQAGGRSVFVGDEKKLRKLLGSPDEGSLERSRFGTREFASGSLKYSQHKLTYVESYGEAFFSLSDL